MGKVREVEVDWYPQPKQMEMLRAAGLLGTVVDGLPPQQAVCETIGYGGAAFGGKSDGLVGLAGAACMAWKGIKVGYFRRQLTDMEGAGGAIPRSEELFTGIGRYNKGKHYWKFPNGSMWYFCHAQNETDVYKYKSQAFDILLIDEATSFTWFQVDYLTTRNRPSGDSGLKPFRVFTTNPGDVGHTWYSILFDVLKRFGEHNRIKEIENPNGKRESVYFIPAFLEDNAIGIARDPAYEARLMARDPQVARALRYGDWTVFEGQAFPQWRYDLHTCEPFDLPLEWPRWRSLDYGWDHPFAAYWFARNPFSKRIYTYREAVARHLTDKEQATLIMENSLPGERFAFTFASPDMWKDKNYDGKVTTAVDEYKKGGVYLTKADNDRVNGKMKINNLLAPLPDMQPGILVFRTCTELIRIMPGLVRDKLHPEDVKKVDGDDPYDGWRYGFTNTKLAENTKPTGATPAKPIKGPWEN